MYQSRIGGPRRGLFPPMIWSKSEPVTCGGLTPTHPRTCGKSSPLFTCCYPDQPAVTRQQGLIFISVDAWPAKHHRTSTLQSREFIRYRHYAALVLHGYVNPRPLVVDLTLHLHRPFHFTEIYCGHCILDSSHLGGTIVFLALHEISVQFDIVVSDTVQAIRAFSATSRIILFL